MMGYKCNLSFFDPNLFFLRLKKDSIVRFRIIGDTIKGNEMNAIATIADDYLGVIKRS